jgi:hypothetical protein
MPSIDHVNKEVLFKIVYYGPGLGGKTTNLEYIYETAEPERCGTMLTLCSESERTLFFDLLPVGLGGLRRTVLACLERGHATGHAGARRRSSQLEHGRQDIDR